MACVLGREDWFMGGFVNAHGGVRISAFAKSRQWLCSTTRPAPFLVDALGAAIGRVGRKVCSVCAFGRFLRRCAELSPERLRQSKNLHFLRTFRTPIP
jgi:hypothetical protein